MQLLVLGTGEAFDDKGLGNTSFIYSAKRQPTVLFDCGYQVPERLWQYPKIYPSIDAIYLTHLHGDHTMGLAPLFIRFLEEGRTKPLTIIGPKGVLRLPEGAIRAQRHVHMSPETAKEYGLQAGDKIKVKAHGPAALTFDDVVVRLGKDLILQMHIDTDEANAAGLDRHGAFGEMIY